MSWPLISDIAASVNKGETKSIDLVKKALAAIEDMTEFDAIIATTTERAINRAEKIDERIKKGEYIGRLAGVPFIAKDNFLTFGAETTAASNILKGFNAPYQATVIEKLEAEGEREGERQPEADVDQRVDTDIPRRRLGLTSECEAPEDDEGGAHSRRPFSEE